MGKYMRKAKISDDVAIMEVSHSSLGVRTRAKTLALQRVEESSYLQLRSRRLEKPPLLKDHHHHHQQSAQEESCRENPNPRSSSRLRVSSVNSGSIGFVSIDCSKKEEGLFDNHAVVASEAEGTEDDNDFGVEASFGENNLEIEGCRERSTRESTPCSFIRDSDTFGTPGSTTRPINSNAANRRTQNNAMQRNIPTTYEMEEFFAFAEQQQQKLFTEKYNFDVVNDLPLPGRYEWVRV